MDYALKERIDDLQNTIQELLVSKAMDESDEHVLLGLIDKNLILLKAIYNKISLLEEEVSLLSMKESGSSSKRKAKTKKKSIKRKPVKKKKRRKDKVKS